MRQGNHTACRINQSRTYSQVKGSSPMRSCAGACFNAPEASPGGHSDPRMSTRHSRRWRGLPVRQAQRSFRILGRTHMKDWMSTMSRGRRSRRLSRTTPPAANKFRWRLRGKMAAPRKLTRVNDNPSCGHMLTPVSARLPRIIGPRRGAAQKRFETGSHTDRLIQTEDRVSCRSSSTELHSIMPKR
jgi:hypothetical protein